MPIAAARVAAVYGALVAVSTAVGLILNWRLSLWLLLLVIALAAAQAMVYRSSRVWLFWLGLRLGPASGLRRFARRIANTIDPPSVDERYSWDSRPRVGAGGQRGIPLVVPARLANRHKTWPHWAFNIRIIRGGLEISAEASGPVVTVRFKADDFAIYNNDGKKWLRTHPRQGEDYDARVSLEEDFAAALREAQRRHDGWSTTVASGFPLRWASGGCLPIVEIEGDKWVALLFRDLAPIGWNVANGASESVREQMEVTSVLRREFREELIVLTEDPTQGSGHPPKAVHARTLVWAGEKQRCHQTPGLALRRRDDDMTFVDDVVVCSEQAVEVAPRSTPWRIRIIAPEGKSTWLYNTFPSIDVREHGVEAIQVVTFSLESRNVLLDGEVLEKTDALVRRPVALLRLTTLRELYRESRSLGKLLNTGSKVLPVIPAEDIRVTPVEAHLAKVRRTRLQRETAAAHDVGAEMRHLAPCIDRLESLRRGVLEPKLQMDRLGPVTWSTLEALFSLEERDAGVAPTDAR